MLTSFALPQWLQTLWQRLARYQRLWPLISFGSGIFSFLLVNRQQSLGAWLAVALLATWLGLTIEALWQWRKPGNARSKLPRMVTTFLAQMTHQETLFFCLPFFLVTTVWTSPQALFTSLLLLAALISILDPFYFALAERHRWLYFAFHGLCVLVLMLVSLPLLIHLTTGESLLLAALAIPLVSLPSLANLFRPRGVASWLALIGLATLLGAGTWLSRGWIPPATLWIDASALSPGFNESARTPQGRIPLTAEAVRNHGLYAYTAIHAPRGLNERIFHVWRHNGEVVDRIALTIRGVPGHGYRAWSHKQNFGRDITGRWRIDVVTDAGQQIGVIRFQVGHDRARVEQADGHLRRTAGIGWLHPAGIESRRDVSEKSQ
ncbi:DUF5924 family protein [Kushneria phosphatilytica]|uniref:DUF2914 domain-containing protein n=1 Tax=Kushneria phosphatilytica TaxID=657387 RepID=A0A1S1NST5_9GAMM|nr:DUF5924 family protein [Kushneria phosphatilytica]OHV12324.1 hypothetical protein BH688_06810 [Kushneria phosphatilytica]QEL11530.1 DUF2914 domain-containing protein [Kushneria phosphatilytica]